MSQFLYEILTTSHLYSFLGGFFGMEIKITMSISSVYLQCENNYSQKLTKTVSVSKTLAILYCVEISNPSGENNARLNREPSTQPIIHSIRHYNHYEIHTQNAKRGP